MTPCHNNAHLVKDLQSVHYGVLKRLAELNVNYKHNAMEYKELNLY
jgi:hypothetical protein